MNLVRPEAIKKLKAESLGPGEIVWLKLDLINIQGLKLAEELLRNKKRLDILCQPRHEVVKII